MSPGRPQPLRHRARRSPQTQRRLRRRATQKSTDRLRDPTASLARRRQPLRLTMLLCRVKGFGEEFGDLLSEQFGAGAGQSDGGDDASVAAPESDEPGLSWGSSAGGGGAGIDLDGYWWHGGSLRVRGGSGWMAAGLRTRQGRAARVEGKLLLGHVCSAGRLGRGRPANRSQASTDAAAEYWVRPSPGHVG
jgi:hypothetical protein